MLNRIGVVGLASVALLAYGVACSSDDSEGSTSSGDGGTGANASGGSSGATQGGGTESGGNSGSEQSGGNSGFEETGGSSGSEETGGNSGSSGTSGAAGDSGGGTGGGSLDSCDTFVGFEDCGSESREAQHQDVNVLLVMDKSGSMAQTPDGYDTDKWSAMSSALQNVLSNVRGDLNLGLEFFPTSASDVPIPVDCGDSGRCCEMPEGAEMNVNIGSGWDTVSEILRQFSDADPAGGTPTAVALHRAYLYFTEGAGADLEGDRIVVLATDGGPNCNADLVCSVDQCTLNIDNADGCPPDGVSCCENTRTACLDHDRTLEQIQALAEIDVPTIVVGIPGAEQYYSSLETYAEVGGFINPDGSIGYYEVPAQGGVQSLTETFETITVALVQDCEILVTEEIQNPNVVNVAVDCVLIEQGDIDDEGSRWYFDNPEDPTRIILDGPICDTIRNEGVQRIDTIYGCPTESLG